MHLPGADRQRRQHMAQRAVQVEQNHSEPCDVLKRAVRVERRDSFPARR